MQNKITNFRKSGFDKMYGILTLRLKKATKTKTFCKRHVMAPGEGESLWSLCREYVHPSFCLQLKH